MKTMACDRCRRPRPVHWFPANRRGLPEPQSMCSWCRAAYTRRHEFKPHTVIERRRRWRTWLDQHEQVPA